MTWLVKWPVTCLRWSQPLQCRVLHLHQSDTTPANDDINESQSTPWISDAGNTNIEQQIDTIILEKTDTTTPEDERDATHGRHPSLASHVALGLLNTLPNVIIALCLLHHSWSPTKPAIWQSYMSIRCVVNKGKQFNYIQSGSFKHRFAALQDLQLSMVQAGWHPSWLQPPNRRRQGQYWVLHISEN